MDTLGRGVLGWWLERDVRPVEIHSQQKRRRKMSDIAVFVVAEQSRDAIRRRRTIRETFHDSKAITVPGKKTRHQAGR